MNDMTITSPTTPSSVSMRHLNLEIGNLAIIITRTSIQVRRLDVAHLPEITVTHHADSGSIEAAIVFSTSQSDAAHKTLARTTKETLDKFMAPIAQLITSRADLMNKDVTGDSLSAEGYRVIRADQLQIPSSMLEVHDRRHATIFPQGVTDLDWESIAHLSTESSVIDSPNAGGAHDSPYFSYLAVQPHDADLSRALWVQRLPSGWVTRPVELFDSTTLEKIRGAFLAEPRLSQVVLEIVRALNLTQWFSEEGLRSAIQDALPPLQRIAFEHCNAAYELEHFHSVGVFAANSAATRLNEASGTQGDTSPKGLDLYSFQGQLAEHTISRLLENFEVALAGLTRRALDCAFETLSREEYDGLKKNTAHPDQCLECLETILDSSTVAADGTMFREIKEDLKFPLALRNLWTHGGRCVTEKFFRSVGLNGKSRVTKKIFSMEIELRVGAPVQLVDKDIEHLSKRLAEFISAVAARLEGLDVIRSGDS